MWPNERANCRKEVPWWLSEEPTMVLWCKNYDASSHPSLIVATQTSLAGDGRCHKCGNNPPPPFPVCGATQRGWRQRAAQHKSQSRWMKAVLPSPVLLRSESRHFLAEFSIGSTARALNSILITLTDLNNKGAGDYAGGERTNRVPTHSTSIVLHEKKKTMRIEATNQDHTPIAPSCPNHVFPPSLIGPAKLADLAYYSNDRWPTLPVSKISPRWIRA